MVVHYITISNGEKGWNNWRLVTDMPMVSAGISPELAGTDALWMMAPGSWHTQPFWLSSKVTWRQKRAATTSPNTNGSTSQVEQDEAPSYIYIYDNHITVCISMCHKEQIALHVGSNPKYSQQTWPPPHCAVAWECSAHALFETTRRTKPLWVVPKRTTWSIGNRGREREREHKSTWSQKHSQQMPDLTYMISKVNPADVERIKQLTFAEKANAIGLERKQITSEGQANDQELQIEKVKLYRKPVSLETSQTWQKIRKGTSESIWLNSRVNSLNLKIKPFSRSHAWVHRRLCEA